MMCVSFFLALGLWSHSLSHVHGGSQAELGLTDGPAGS